MRYYIPTVLEEAYSLSKDAIMYRIRKGILKAIKIPMSVQSPHHFFYAIPESELYKIEKFKLREPRFVKEHQPEFQQEYFRKRAEEQKAWEKHCEIIRQRNERYKSYDDYIASEDWQKKRLQRLKIDDFQCQRCGTAKNLRVHHITYRHFRDEPMEDLITLCDSCHRKIHEHDFLSDRVPYEEIDKDLGVDKNAEEEEDKSCISNLSPEILKFLFPATYEKQKQEARAKKKAENDAELQMLLEELCLNNQEV